MSFIRLLIFIFTVFYAINAGAAVCVEDNRQKCSELGYTSLASACQRDGVACPFNRAYYRCPVWTCEDGGYLSEENPNYWSLCLITNYKGKKCFECTCDTPKKDCAVGDVFFHDGTCAATYDKCMGRIPVGIVYMLTDADGNIVEGETSRYGRVIGRDDLALPPPTYVFDPEHPYAVWNKYELSYWGLYNTDIPGITNYQFWSNLIPAFQAAIGKEGSSEIYDGKGNTQKIANTSPAYASCVNGTYQPETLEYVKYCYPAAAKSTLEYYPSSSLKDNPKVGAGNWYLPSIGELLYLYGIDVPSMDKSDTSSGIVGGRIDLINNALFNLTKNGMSHIKNLYYTSSTVSNSASWLVNMSTGSHINGNSRIYGSHVRPSLQFRNTICSSEFNAPSCPEHAASCTKCSDDGLELFKVDGCDLYYEYNPATKQCEKKPCAIGDVYYSDGTCSAVADFDGIKTPVGIVYMLTDEAGNSLGIDSDFGINYDAKSSHGRIINLRDLTLQSDYSFDPANPYTGTVYEIPWGYVAQETGNEQYPAYFAYLGEMANYLGNESEAAIWNNKALQDNILNIMLPFREEANKEENCPQLSMEEDMLGYLLYCTPSAAEIAQLFYPSLALKNDMKFGAGKWYVPTFADFLFMSFMTETLENTLSDLGKAGIMTQNLAGTFLTLTEDSDEEYINFYKDFAYSQGTSKDKPALMRVISFF